MHPNLETLRRLRPLSRFSDKQLTQLAAHVVIQTAKKRTRLIEIGCCERSSLYLLDGSIALTAKDGLNKIHHSSPEGDINPIAQIRPAMYTVDSISKVIYLKIESDQLTQFANQIDDTNQLKLASITKTKQESELVLQIFQDMTSGNINLPSLPDVALRIQQEFNRPFVDINDVCYIIQSDPAITAKLIMAANSPLYRGRANIDSLNLAVVRLGLKTTQQLVFSYAIKDLFRSDSMIIQKRMQILWQHSRKVASLSKIIAKVTLSFDPERAQLAGLVHDLGEIAILQYAQRHKTLCDDSHQLLKVIRNLRPQITSILLDKWNFGEEFATVGQQSEEWFRNPTNNADLCDLVMIAQYHSMIDTPEISSLPPISKLPAFSKLGMSQLTTPEIIQFMADSKTEIDLIEVMLGNI